MADRASERALRVAGGKVRRKGLLARVGRWLRPDFRPIATYVGNNRVLVGTRVGGQTMAFYVEADDRLFAPYFIATGRFEAELTDHVLRALRPDSHCLDIGANFGYYSCLMARQCPRGRVIGVEPDSRIADLAWDNLLINGGQQHAEIVRAAAGDRRSELTLYRRITRSGNSSVVAADEAFTHWMGEPPAEPFIVESVRIDDLAQRMEGRVDVIKIDVEGAEPLVLAGARQTIRRNRGIMIVMEWSPGQIAGAGFDLHCFVDDIAAMGLRCFRLEQGREVPIEAGALATLPYQPGIVLRRADAR